MANFRISNTGLVMFDQALVSGSNFLTGVLLARVLGLDVFGYYSLSWVLVLVMNNLQISLVVAPMMSLYPLQKDEETRFFLGAIVLQQMVFLIASTIIILLSIYIAVSIFGVDLLSQVAIPLTCAASGFLLQDFVRRSYFALGDSIRPVVSDMVSYLGQLVIFATIFFVFDLEATLYRVLWVMAFTSLVGALLGAGLLNLIEFERKAINKFVRESLNFSKWLSFAGVFQVMAMNFYVFVAAAILGPAAAGGIKAAQNLVGVLKVMYQGLNNIIPRETSRLIQKEGDLALMKYVINITIKWGAVALTFTAAIFAMPAFLMSTIYGNEYAGYSDVLAWFAVIYFMAFFEIPIWSYLRAMQETRSIFSCSLIMLVVSLITAYPFCYYWGINGAMFGMLVTTFSMIAFSARSARVVHLRLINKKVYREYS